MLTYTLEDYIKHYNKIMFRIFILVVLLPFVPALICDSPFVSTYIGLFMILFLFLVLPIFAWCIYHKKDVKYAFLQEQLNGTIYYYSSGDSGGFTFIPYNSTKHYDALVLGKVGRYKLGTICVYGRKERAYVVELEDPSKISSEEKQERTKLLNEELRLPEGQLIIYIIIFVCCVLLAIGYLLKRYLI